MRHLADKVFASSEKRGFEHLHANGRTPPFELVGPAVAREATGDRLDEQGQRITLVPMIEASGREQCARRVAVYRRF